jgi:hypothetical protein
MAQALRSLYARPTVPTDSSLPSNVSRTSLSVTRPFSGTPPISREPSAATRDPEACPERPVPDTWSSGLSCNLVRHSGQHVLAHTFRPQLGHRAVQIRHKTVAQRVHRLGQGTVLPKCGWPPSIPVQKYVALAAADLLVLLQSRLSCTLDWWLIARTQTARADQDKVANIKRCQGCSRRGQSNNVTLA